MTKYAQIHDTFQVYDRKYFFTIKPPVDKVCKIYGILSYLDTRTNCYMIVHCKSKHDYEHFHGILSLKDKVNPEAIRRKVNREMGFLQIDPMNDFFRSYNYINDTDRNIPIARFLKLNNNEWGHVANALNPGEAGPAGGHRN